jgi:hypothetical protein
LDTRNDLGNPKHLKKLEVWTKILGLVAAILKLLKELHLF